MANVVELTLKLKKQGDAIKKIKAEFDELETSIGDTNDDLVKTDKNIDKLGKNSIAIKSLGVGFVAAGAAIAAFSAKMVSVNKELKELANLSGLSFQAFQEFAYAAELGGSTAGQASDAINDLGLKIQEALILKSGLAIDVFKKLGLSIEEVSKLSPEKQFEILAKSLQNVDEAQRKLYLDELASDALISLKPLIDNYDEFAKKAKDFRNSGGFITDDDNQKVTNLGLAFNQLSTQINASGSKLVGTFSNDLIPIFTDFVEKLQELSTSDGFSVVQREAKRLISVFLLVYNSISFVLNGVTTFAKTSVESIRYAVDTIKNILDGDFKVKSFDLSVLTDDTKDIQKNFEGIKDSLAGLTSPEISLAFDNSDDIETEIFKLQEKISKGKPIELDAETAKIEIKIKQIQESLKNLVGSGKAEESNYFKALLDNVNNYSDALENLKSQNNLNSFLSEQKINVNDAVVDIPKIQNSIDRQLKNVNLLKLELAAKMIDEEEFKTKSKEAINSAITEIKKIIDNTNPNDINLIDYKSQLATLTKDLQEVDKVVSASNAERKQFSESLIALQTQINKAKGDEKVIAEDLLNNQIRLIENDKVLSQNSKDILKKKTEELNTALKLENQEKSRNAFKKLSLELDKEILKNKGDEVALSKLNAEQRILEIKNSETLLKNEKDLLISKENQNETIKNNNIINEKALKDAELKRDYENSILEYNKELLSIKGKDKELNDLIIAAKKEEIDNDIKLNDIQKSNLKAKIDAVEKEKEAKTLRDKAVIDSQNLINYNKSLLDFEKQILSEKGMTKELSALILDDKLKEIDLNKNLDDQQKAALSAKVLELNELQKANDKIKEITSTNTTSLNTEPFADNSARFSELESQKQALISLEEQYGLTSAASDQLQLKIDNDNKTISDSYTKLSESMSKSIASSLISVANGTQTIEGLFTNMLTNILQKILESQIQQGLASLFGGISGGSGGSSGGFASLVASFFHSGGIVGQEGFKKDVAPKVYHTGGIVGLKPDDVPTVLQKGEEVLTENDPRHRNNGGNAGNSSQAVNITNIMSADTVAQSLDGNQSFGNAIINYITSNRDEVKNTLNS